MAFFVALKKIIALNLRGTVLLVVCRGGKDTIFFNNKKFDIDMAFWYFVC